MRLRARPADEEASITKCSGRKALNGSSKASGTANGGEAEDAAGSSPVTPTISSVHNVYEVMNTRFFCFYAVLVVLKYSTSTPFLVLTFILSKFSGISSSPMNL